MSKERDQQQRELIDYIQLSTTEARAEGQRILDETTGPEIINLMRQLQVEMFNSPFKPRGDVRVAITPGENPILHLTTVGGVRNNDGVPERWPPNENI
jgi:hypothetical protein